MFDRILEWFEAATHHVVETPLYVAAPLMVLVGALDSSLLSLPEVNDYITIARIIHDPPEVYYFPLFPAIGSVIGCLVLYCIARRGEQFITRRFHPKHLERVKMLYQRWGLMALAVPALLPPPMPFKIFVATAGFLGYPVGRFAAVIMAARLVRYYIWGIAAYFLRERVLKALDYMKQHLEVLGAALGIILLALLTRWVVLRVRERSMRGKAEASYTD